MTPSLKNKDAMITGSSTGIGREIAQLPAGRGARVFGTARDPKSASPIPGVELTGMDVTDDGSVTGAVRSIVQRAGLIHFVVNNVGYPLGKGIMLSRLRRFLPASLSDRAIRNEFRLNQF